MFEDGSTVTLILDTVFKTDSWRVLPETAVKNGVQVLPNSGQVSQEGAVRVTPSIGPGGEVVWPMKCHAYSILAERNGVQTTTTPQVCYFEP